MQDQFVGDIGDFGKYGLLRWLTGTTGPYMDQKIRLGVIWYYNCRRGQGGQKISYLGDLTYNQYDPCLHIVLRRIVKGPRNIVCVENSGILPSNTLYQNEEIHDNIDREDWLRRSFDKTGQASLIFFDPDNGFRPHEENLRSQNIYVGDLERFSEKNIVVYHHFNRDTSHTEQIRDWSERIRAQLNPFHIWALRYQHNGVGRAYFLVVQKESYPLFNGRLRRFFHSPWAKLFMPIDLSLLQSE